MDFCEECGALMFPRYEKKSRKYVMICKRCGNQTQLRSTALEDYILTYSIPPLKKEKICVIKGKHGNTQRITEEEREAFEDYFDDDSGVILI
ncbi:MAG: hypothetical protein ACTSQI_14295 [Candidatus Helarchaeota archaeon]